MLLDTLENLADSFKGLQIQILNYVSYYFDDILFDAIKGCQSCIKVFLSVYFNFGAIV